MHYSSHEKKKLICEVYFLYRKSHKIVTILIDPCMQSWKLKNFKIEQLKKILFIKFKKFNNQLKKWNEEINFICK